jgi:hypothetical protein
MIEHLVPVYILATSLLAEALNHRNNLFDSFAMDFDLIAKLFLIKKQAKKN